MVNIQLTINEPKWTRSFLGHVTAYGITLDISLAEYEQMKRLCQKILTDMVNYLALDDCQSELSLLFTNDTEIQSLNAQWRQKDKATNVLSFPAPRLKSGRIGPFLGDIIFAYETIEAQAITYNKPLYAHFYHLFVHGFLHLLGYDHQDDKGAEEMEQLEIAILQQNSIKNPYEF